MTTANLRIEELREIISHIELLINEADAKSDQTYIYELKSICYGIGRTIRYLEEVENDYR